MFCIDEMFTRIFFAKLKSVKFAKISADFEIFGFHLKISLIFHKISLAKS